MRYSVIELSTGCWDGHYSDKLTADGSCSRRNEEYIGSKWVVVETEHNGSEWTAATYQGNTYHFESNRFHTDAREALSSVFKPLQEDKGNENCWIVTELVNGFWAGFYADKYDAEVMLVKLKKRFKRSAWRIEHACSSELDVNFFYGSNESLKTLQGREPTIEFYRGSDWLNVEIDEEAKYDEREVAFESGRVILNERFKDDPDGNFSSYCFHVDGRNKKSAIDGIRHLTTKGWITKNQLTAVIFKINKKYGSGY